MDDPFSIRLRCNTADETKSLAEKIAPVLSAGDCLFLIGPIGAGKTHFARSLIQARLADLGRHEDVPSPTFTLVQTYDLSDVELWHADLYRLTDTMELPELGLDEAFETAITLVEWPDLVPPDVAARALKITFGPAEDDAARNLTFDGPASHWPHVKAVLLGEQAANV